MDLLISHARLAHKKGLFHIGIKDGKFAAVVPASDMEHPPDAEQIIDACGRLVVPPLVESHIHLDAALTATVLRENKSGTLAEAIPLWRDIKEMLNQAEIKARAKQVVQWLVVNGCGFIRAHTDCGDDQFRMLRAIQEVKEEMKHLVDIQIVAFPQEGILTSQKQRDVFIESVRMGVDIIGGLPQAEQTERLGKQSLQTIFQLAETYNLPIDIHADESADSQMRFTEMIAQLTIAHHMHHHVTASHATAMHVYDDSYVRQLIELLAKAEMNIVTNPTSNTLLQNRGSYPRARGITRVDELIKAGVNISIGNDNVMDPFGLFGNGDLLQTAWLLAHVGHLSNPAEVEILVKMVTENGAKTLGIADQYGIHAGADASAIMLDAQSVHDAIRLSPDCLYHIRQGSIIAKTTPAQHSITTNGIATSVDFHTNSLDWP